MPWPDPATVGGAGRHGPGGTALAFAGRGPPRPASKPRRIAACSRSARVMSRGRVTRRSGGGGTPVIQRPVRRGRGTTSGRRGRCLTAGRSDNERPDPGRAHRDPLGLAGAACVRSNSSLKAIARSTRSHDHQQPGRGVLPDALRGREPVSPRKYRWCEPGRPVRPPSARTRRPEPRRGTFAR